MQSLHLLYHELRPGKSSYSYVVGCDEFAQHMALFARLRSSAGPWLRPEITFDDGHTSDLESALPVLDRHGVQAHFFITAGWTGKKPGYMGWQDLRSLHAAGQIIGAHGWSHTLLTHCSPAELETELKGARQALEDGLGAPVISMSLPGGRSNRTVIAACRDAGYTEIFTSVPRAEPIPHGELIGRLNIRGDMTLPWLEDLLRPGSGVLSGIERQHRIKATAKSLLGDRLYAKLWGLLNREETEPEWKSDTGA